MSLVGAKICFAFPHYDLNDCAEMQSMTNNAENWLKSLAWGVSVNEYN